MVQYLEGCVAWDWALLSVTCNFGCHASFADRIYLTDAAQQGIKSTPSLAKGSIAIRTVSGADEGACRVMSRGGAGS